MWDEIIYPFPNFNGCLCNNKSTWFQVMVWCRHVRSHYLNKFWQRSMPRCPQYFHCIYSDNALIYRTPPTNVCRPNTAIGDSVIVLPCRSRQYYTHGNDTDSNNSWWPIDAKWCEEAASSLFYVMENCLAALSPNQCCLIVNWTLA